ncbi:MULTISPECIES: MerR family transcriptional regulator [unclassified Streptomyces]|uniref:MerR family transcriptional regulator n=1 Tax=unclassified Streptomyces TaxID=2593676 RepID=UPI00081BA627|nr:MULTISPECIES: MerR family transcriptional regulator [unclassified Streptomyces]MYQ89263.1 MerR family transcriptional regulator [Streptomyces sp. SID4936]SCE58016.1 DNA-binding transcriptional regulator, MerR family [Streptomyces sp. DvalAA-43]
MAIAEAARRTGVSVHTLRYYERVGLVITGIERTAGGRRRYHRRDLEWITLCTELRATGMPIKAILQYAPLVADGYRDEEERLALMEAHRAEATAGIAELRENLSLIDHKIDVYRTGPPRRARGGSSPPAPACRAGWSSAGRTRGDFRARCSQAPRAPASLDPGRDRTVVA